MKQNILVVSYDYRFSKSIASKLAEVFSMHLFDEIELFEFDHIPQSIDEIWDSQGKRVCFQKIKINSKIRNRI